MPGRISRCADRRGQDGKSIWGRISLQSLEQMNRGSMRSARGGGAMPVEAIGAPF
jgi:hypothetical protein